MAKPAVKTTDITFSYEGSEKLAVDKARLELEEGSYVALLGANGSGKSTLAKLIDVLEVQDDGTIEVFGIDTKDEDRFWDIRRNTACVFQNPDNQIVGTTVEEDVAFGPENIGVPNPELRERVDKALRYVGLYDRRESSAAKLSGGQKQKLAIAGVLAMAPKLLLLDEATAMLDPVSRDEFLLLIEKLVREKGITVLTITHDMTEASRTDKVYVMDKGMIALEGEPRDILNDVPRMLEAGLDSPIYSKLIWELKNVTGKSYKHEDCTSIISALRYMSDNFFGVKIKAPKREEISKETLVNIKNLSYRYEDNGRFALKDIDLQIHKGELLAIVGRSGCGKTTLVTHLNGIIRPQGDGDVEFRYGDEVLSTTRKKDIKKIRQKVGLVFQYPEYQLFEETVYKDIAYGPKMMGITGDELDKAVREAAKKVGLADEVLDQSPFELSGGQQRRVAMAGVIAMEPEVLVLDEPAAGLDPKGRRAMFETISKLKEKGTTIVLVTHYMDEAYEHADRICTMRDGMIMGVKTPVEMFEDKEEVRDMEIRSPYLRRYLEIVAIKLGLDSVSKNNLLMAQSVREAALLIGGKDA